MTNQWIEQAIDEARAERERLLDSIRPTLQDVRRIDAAIAALTGEPEGDEALPTGADWAGQLRAPDVEITEEPTAESALAEVEQAGEAIKNVREAAERQGFDVSPTPEPEPGSKTAPERHEIMAALQGRGGSATIQEVLGIVGATEQGDAFRALVRQGLASRDGDTLVLTEKGHEWTPRPPHKSKRTGGAIDFGGPELLPEHLRLLPSATKSMAVEKRIVAAEKEETALRLLEQAGPGGLLSNVLASKLGDRTNKTHLSDVGRRLRALNDGGFVEELGTGFAPWQDPARKAGKGGGRPAIRYGITRKGLKALGEPVEDDDDLSEHSTATTAPLRSPDPSRPSDGTHVPENAEPRLELVRDKATLMTSPFTAAELLVEQDLDWDMRVTMVRLAQLAQQRILDSREELRGTTYGYERPTSPGKAAELTQAQRREREREGVATPVPGTGTRGLFTGNAKVNKLLRAVSRQGGTYRRTGGDHWLVEYNGGRRTIAGTPNEAGLKKDIAKLRRLGLAV